MRKTTVAGIALGLALALGACGASDTDDGGALKKVTVDGTTCVVFDSYGYGGVSCDWGNK